MIRSASLRTYACRSPSGGIFETTSGGIHFAHAIGNLRRWDALLRLTELRSCEPAGAVAARQGNIQPGSGLNPGPELGQICPSETRVRSGRVSAPGRRVPRR